MLDILSVWLTSRFGNTLYRVKFFIAERLAVGVIVGTAFLHLHLLAILSIEQRIWFCHGELPIVK